MGWRGCRAGEAASICVVLDTRSLAFLVLLSVLSASPKTSEAEAELLACPVATCWPPLGPEEPSRVYAPAQPGCLVLFYFVFLQYLGGTQGPSTTELHP